ncbi:MAG TPA: hypothetical protein VFJ57_14685 [Solirubrobacterales bacterium]|nr:hypothetical protein [Solirubrobacterales bacterium]
MAAASALLAPASALANVAPCEKAVLGHGPPGWRARAIVAGPVGVFKHPLTQMSPTGNGLVAKMPILVEGQTPVTVRVPPRLHGRVFLYYGNLLDRDGHPSTGFANTRGEEETKFVPCAGRPRTPWPGGIRVKGTAPVQLTVAVDGGETFQLRLGRPRLR